MVKIKVVCVYLFIYFFALHVLLLLLLYAEFVTVRNWCFQLGHFLVGD